MHVHTCTHTCTHSIYCFLAVWGCLWGLFVVCVWQWNTLTTTQTPHFSVLGPDGHADAHVRSNAETKTSHHHLCVFFSPALTGNISPVRRHSATAEERDPPGEYWTHIRSPHSTLTPQTPDDIILTDDRDRNREKKIYILRRNVDTLVLTLCIC